MLKLSKMTILHLSEMHIVKHTYITPVVSGLYLLFLHITIVSLVSIAEQAGLALNCGYPKCLLFFMFKYTEDPMLLMLTMNYMYI